MLISSHPLPYDFCDVPCSERVGRQFVITNRLIIPLLVAASVAFAKGTTGHKETLASSSSTKPTSELSSTFSVKANGRVHFQLDVRNNTSRMLELRFPSGLTHDFIVRDASGREVWRWSSSRMFTQGVQNKLIKGSESAVYVEDWDSGPLKGRFTAVAILPSENHPIEESVEFELK